MQTKINLTDAEQSVMAFIKANGPSTCKDMGVSLAQVKPLLNESGKGLVKITATRKHVNPQTGEPSRGRPEFVMGFTKRGRDKARRLVAA